MQSFHLNKDFSGLSVAIDFSFHCQINIPNTDKNIIVKVWKGGRNMGLVLEIANISQFKWYYIKRTKLVIQRYLVKISTDHF